MADVIELLLLLLVVVVVVVLLTAIEFLFGGGIPYTSKNKQIRINIYKRNNKKQNKNNT